MRAVCSVVSVSGSPPLQVPLFMIATRGATACTSAREFDVFSPWCETT